MHQQDGIEAGICNRQIMHVAGLKTDIGVIAESFFPRVHDPLTDIQALDALGAWSEEFSQHAVP